MIERGVGLLALVLVRAVSCPQDVMMAGVPYGWARGGVSV
jgi:hypothetical protein